jgi:hypothetical protein
MITNVTDAEIELSRSAGKLFARGKDAFVDKSVSSQPLFKHPWLIAAVMLSVLAIATGGALYVRPLSGDMQAAQAASKAAAAPAVLGVFG